MSRELLHHQHTDESADCSFEAGETPGKRTRSQDLPAPVVRLPLSPEQQARVALQELTAALARLRGDIARLGEMIRALDFEDAILDADAVRCSIDHVDRQLAEADRLAGGDDAMVRELTAARAERDDLVGQATPLLDAAPERGPAGELDDAVFGSDQVRTATIEARERRRSEWLDRQKPRVVEALLPAVGKFLKELKDSGLCPGGRIPALVVRSRDGGNPYFEFPEGLSTLTLLGKKEGKRDQPDGELSDGELLGRVGEDLLIGLAGGIAVALIDYIRFSQARATGKVDEYRLEQVGTQVLVATLVDRAGGTGATLAFAAFQWCFTNDLFYYAFAELLGNSGLVPEGSDDSFLAKDSKVTWASWSFLGVLGGIGNDQHPMTYGQVMAQGLIFGPLMAAVLAMCVEGLHLDDLLGRRMSIAIENIPEQDVTYQALLQTLCARVNLGSTVELLGRLSPYIIDGRQEGTKFEAAIQMTDEVVTALMGVTVARRSVGEDDQGKPLASVSTTRFNFGVQYQHADGKDRSLLVKASLDLPIGETVKRPDDSEMSRLEQDALDIHEDTDVLAKLHVAYKDGPWSLRTDLLARLGTGQYRLSTDVTFETGQVYFSGQVAYVHSIDHDGFTYRLKLTVDDPIGGIRKLFGAP